MGITIIGNPVWNVWNIFFANLEVNVRSIVTSLLWNVNYIRNADSGNSFENIFLEINDETKPRGLKNFSNTCYFNVILQCLSRTPNLLELNNNLERLSEDEELRCEGMMWTTSFTFLFCRVMEELVSGKQETFIPKELYDQFVGKVPYFAGDEQHDCHNFLNALFNVLSEEKLISTEKIFGGVLKRSLECQGCKNVSIVDEGFQDLSLPITKDDGCLLTECLELLTAGEFLTESEQVVCDVCTEQSLGGTPVLRDFRIQHQVSKVPAVLVLNLKRYRYSNNCITKNNAFVEFPNILDFTPYYYCQMDQTIPGEKILYALYGVIEHSGRYGHGHYTSYVKIETPIIDLDLINNEEDSVDPLDEVQQDVSSSLPEASDGWFHINDHKIISVPTEEVLEAQASLLFYERIL